MSKDSNDDKKRDEAIKRALNMPPKPHAKPAGKKPKKGKSTKL